MDEELENEESVDEKQLEIQLETRGSRIMGGINNAKPKFSQHGKFGICSTCTYLLFAETKFRIVFAICGRTWTSLDTNDPIVKCWEYYNKTQLSLYSMMDIATLIDDEGSKSITPFSNQKK